VEPQQPNALKFERFIFDLLPAADRALVVEVEKARAFAPVKNADGAADDTPQTARCAMVRGDVALLRAAGAEVVEGVDVEVNPLWALDAAEAASRLRPGIRVGQPTYFGPHGPRPSAPAPVGNGHHGAAPRVKGSPPSPSRADGCREDEEPRTEPRVPR
jgi:UDP-N-acetylglucosamine/UDP-N-acetylgalactosamine diphosphorylase